MTSAFSASSSLVTDLQYECRNRNSNFRLLLVQIGFLSMSSHCCLWTHRFYPFVLHQTVPLTNDECEWLCMRKHRSSVEIQYTVCLLAPTSAKCISTFPALW
jgi:hypothetical protein